MTYTDGLEALWVQIKTPKAKPLLITNSSIQMIEKIEMFVRNLEEETIDYVIMGDFNCDLIAEPKWSHTKRFIEILDVYHLKQLIAHSY